MKNSPIRKVRVTRGPNKKKWNDFSPRERTCASKKKRVGLQKLKNGRGREVGAEKKVGKKKTFGRFQIQKESLV